MFLNDRQKYEIRHRALLEAIRRCGGVAAFSRCLKVGRSRASNWLNQPKIHIPYEYAVLTSHLTQVDIERLSPFTEAANKAIKLLRAPDKPQLVSMELTQIEIDKQPYRKSLKLNRPILVGTDGVLISGLAQLELQRNRGIKKVEVLVLDLEALLLEEQKITELNLELFISEKIAVGLCLEKMIGNHQGQRNDLRPPKALNHQHDPSLHRKCDEVKDTKGFKIARILDLPSKDSFYRARQVYLQGDAELIDKLDCKQISIAGALEEVKRIRVLKNKDGT